MREESRRRIVPVPVSVAEEEKLTRPVVSDLLKVRARGIARLADVRGQVRILEQVLLRAQEIAAEEVAKALQDGWPPFIDDPSISAPEGYSSVIFHLDAAGPWPGQGFGVAWLELACTMPES